MDIRTFRTLAGKNRYALFASACLIPATCIQPAFAAEQPEEVIVTGSRIRQSPVEQTAPVQTTTAADIDRSGEVSIADYLQRLPISGSAINRANNASGNLGFPPDGGVWLHTRCATGSWMPSGRTRRPKQSSIQAPPRLFSGRL